MYACVFFSIVTLTNKTTQLVCLEAQMPLVGENDSPHSQRVGVRLGWILKRESQENLAGTSEEKKIQLKESRRVP
jgi:hypothetical protein